MLFEFRTRAELEVLVIVRDFECVRDVLHRTPVHILLVVLRRVNIDRVADVMPVPHELWNVALDSPLVCRLYTADSFLDFRRAVVGLCRLCRCAKVNITCVDGRFVDRSLAIAVYVKLIVIRYARAKGVVHRCTQPCILYVLVARIRVGSKVRIRVASAVVACQSTEVLQFLLVLVRGVCLSNVRMIRVQHLGIGIRNKPSDVGVCRCRVIGFRYVFEIHFDFALLDRVVVGRERIAAAALILQVVVPRARGIEVHSVVHLLVRARVQVRVRVIIFGSRRICRVVILRHCDSVVLRQAVECDKSVQRITHDDLARRILDRRSRIVLLRQWVHRDVHISLRNNARAMRLQHCIVREDDVPVVVCCGRIGQLVGNALRSSVVDILRVVIRRRCNRHPPIQIHRRLCTDLHLRLFDIPLDSLLVCRLHAAHKPLDRLSAIVGLRRLCDSAVVNHGIRVNLERRDLAESIQTTVRIGRNFIISRVCAVQLDVRIVDPVVLLRSANDLFITDALDVRALERCAIARLERDHITGDDTARRSNIKADRPGRNIRCAVIDLRDLLERTRNILRRNLARSCDVILQSVLGVRRMCRCTVFVCKCIVLSDIVTNRDIIGDDLIDDLSGSVTRDVLVCIAARNGHHSTIVHLRAVLRAHELIVIRRPRRIDDVRLRIRVDECAVM